VTVKVFRQRSWRVRLSCLSVEPCGSPGRRRTSMSLTLLAADSEARMMKPCHYGGTTSGGHGRLSRKLFRIIGT
jgi:hypothetical protein